MANRWDMFPPVAGVQLVGKHIALGYVPPDVYREGGDYAVEILGQLRPAQLCPAPLYDPDGARMRS